MAYRFDRFVFDRHRRLWAAGKPVALEPQVADLLGYLMEHRERVVSKEELNEAIWDGRFVSEAALSTRIRAVRRALGDDRMQQKFIRTHPKRGFQFVADVEIVDERAPAGTDAVPPLRRRRLPVTAMLALVVLVIFGGLGAWHLQTDQRERARGLSIAVLPFENLSGDPSKDYLADALTEELITDLSRIRDAFVIARSTAFTYRDKDIDAAAVASRLGVRYILEGSVRIDGDAVRVIAQLIDGETNSHIWSDRFERTLADLFDLQDNVTGRIASVLRAELREADTHRQAPDATGNAWDLALRGNVLLYHGPSVADYQKAHTYLSRAVELDPTISSAWSGLGLVHFDASKEDIPAVSQPNSSQLALDAALKAAEIDPRNAEAYWLLGFIYIRTGQPERGMAACETSMDLNPNLDCGWVCAGLVHMARGNPEKAVPYIEYALRLNPMFRPSSKHRYLGIAYLQSRQDEAAIKALSRALAGAPDDYLANVALPAALAMNGDLPEARAALTRWLELSEKAPPTLTELREKLSWLGPGVERIVEGLRAAGIEDVRRTYPVDRPSG